MTSALVQDQVAANKRRSALLAAGFALVVALALLGVDLLVGGGRAGALIAVLLAAAATSVAHRRATDVVLALSHARPADPVDHARLHNLVDGLCVAVGLPRPRIFVVDDDAPNAFTAGRGSRDGVVAVTTGLLGTLNRVELEGVLAHELSHLKNHDAALSTLAVTTVGLPALVAERALRSSSPAAVRAAGVVLLPLAGLAARLLRLAISRRREALADLTGVSLTRYPPGLIAALEKVRAAGAAVRAASPATAHLWLESPLPASESEARLAWLGRLVGTHPPLEERIEALREL